MIKKRRIESMLILCGLLISVLGYSQITIGSGISPTSGALLDIKQTDQSSANSTKGLMLPRVNLTDITNLYPMFEPQTTSPHPDYDDPVKKQKQDQMHLGLIVYNMNTVHPHICPGVYVWTENIWRRLPKPCFDPCTGFDVVVNGPSCGYTGRALNFTSSLTGTTDNIIVDRWTVTKEGATEQVIPSATSADLTYEFPVLTTGIGKYSFTVYYKHKTLGCEKSKTITVDLYDNLLQDYWAGNTTSSGTYEIRAKIYKRTADNDYDYSSGELPLRVVKWSYVKAGTTTEVDMGNAGLNNITYSFRSSGAGKYYIKMTWEDFPCADGLDPEPANNTPTPRRVLHPVVVGELDVRL
ncbi:hypothetical protein JGH11_18180 [Dysgonomonas sp. Marseille-P4677]|uniref:hypothetical protein n=1 Tax=Dysgonomonas sp. Marseille-P4677 TaxID=2364790 RepID=UPI001912B4DD|nr:hypothetical protein [Dysgonomonas sp. Marseille-P4677]MBK5722803.1 hypothetical protein [Dysgonomonas sp. Marseille-P4677]